MIFERQIFVLIFQKAMTEKLFNIAMKSGTENAEQVSAGNPRALLEFTDS
jgi:hypothetical protein